MGERRLGRGLGSLLGASGQPSSSSRSTIRGSLENRATAAEAIVQIPVDAIHANPRQPRQTFDLDTIEELASSLEQHGLIQPIVVCPDGSGQYELVAGERRWRAARSLGWETIRAVERTASEHERLELALIENLQREDLNAMDRAEAIQNLVESFGLTHEDVARRLGKSRPSLSNLLRLLDLPEDLQEMVRDGVLTEGHGRALLALQRDEARRELADRIHLEQLSVRAVEQIIKGGKLGRAAAESRKRRQAERTPQVRDLEERLAKVLGTRVRLKPHGKAGQIVIEYYSLDDFDRILGLIDPAGRR
jgi:ParB family chromosome partitioning protein